MSEVASRDHPSLALKQTTERIDILAGEDALQHGFQIGVLFVSLAPCAAGPRAEVKDNVDVAVKAVGWHDRWGLTHTQPKNRVQFEGDGFVPGTLHLSRH
jgi:hypothetical protein